jgi:hypothetical protein
MQRGVHGWFFAYVVQTATEFINCFLDARAVLADADDDGVIVAAQLFDPARPAHRVKVEETIEISKGAQGGPETVL